MKSLRIVCGLFCTLLVVFILKGVPVHAEGGRVIIDCKTEANVGDELKITIRCIDTNNSVTTGKIQFKYSTEKYSYVSCDTADASELNGVVSVSGKSVVITLKAKSEGKSIVTAFATDEAGNELTAAGVTINNVISGGNGQPQEGESSDNTLSSLKIEGVVLAPSFQSSIKNYTASVENSVTELTINASTSNSGARIASITGADSLQVGENNVKITVEAENGETTTYVIRITRLEVGETPEIPNNGEQNKAWIEMDGVTYLISSEFDNTMLESGFQPLELLINDIPTFGLRYGDTNVVVLHLINSKTGKDAGYYVYDAKTQAVCPYVGYGSGGEDAKKLDSIQENYSKLYKKYEKLKQKNRNMLIGIIIGVAALIVVVVNLFIFRSLNRKEDYEVDYDSTDGGEPLKRQGEYLDAIASNSRGKEEEISDVELPKIDISEAMDSKQKTKWVKEDSDEVEVIDLEDL